MKKFETGDVVKVVSKGCASFGNVGIVIKTTDNKTWPYTVKFTEANSEYSADELEKVCSGKKRGRAVPCKVICNNRWGYVATPMEFPSIAVGVRWAKESGWFRYAVFAGGKCVRQGFCND